MVKWPAMGGLRWIANNWPLLLNAGGVITGLVFTSLSFRAEARTRRVSNLIEITKAHRDIWTELYQRRELARILDVSLNVSHVRVTENEELFVTFLIHHLNCTFQAMKHHLFIKQEGLRRDIFWFFSLPIPQTVWEKMKTLQNHDFVAFVESCRNWQ
jgi:hypothetical protein